MDDESRKTGPAPEAERRHGHLFTWWLWGLSLALFVYPLSTGPVYRLIVAGYLPTRTADLYKPLAPLGEVPFTRAFFEWYLIKVWKLEKYR